MRTRRGVIAGFLASGLLPRLGWAALGNPTFLAAAQSVSYTHLTLPTTAIV